jgi:hypothetical protein
MATPRPKATAQEVGEPSGEETTVQVRAQAFRK